MTVDFKVNELFFLMRLVEDDMLQRKHRGEDRLNEAQFKAEAELLARLARVLQTDSSPVPG